MMAANVGNTPPVGSVPRIYYYRTKHRPDVQRAHSEVKPLVGDAVLKPPVSKTPDVSPLEGEQTVKIRGFYLSRENFMQISLGILVLLIAVWLGSFWFGESDNGITFQPIPGVTKPDSRWEEFLAQKIRVIATDEIKLAFADKFAQIDKILKELSRLSQLPTGDPKDHHDEIERLKKQLENLTNDVSTKIQALNGRFSALENSVTKEVKQNLETLRAEMGIKIKEAVEKALPKPEKAISPEDLDKLSAKLDTVQNELKTHTAASQRINDKLATTEASLESLKATAATKKSLDELRALLDKQEASLRETQTKISTSEERIKTWVNQTINSDFIRREVLQVLASRPVPIDHEKVEKLIEDVAATKNQLRDLVAQVASLPSKPDSPNQPSSQPGSPQEVVEKARGLIDSWIRTAIADALPNGGNRPPSDPQHVGESQKKLIETWLEEHYLKKNIPGLIDAANKELSKELTGQMDTIKQALTKLEKDRQTFKLDAATKTMIVQQLREEGVIKGLTSEEVIKIVDEKVDRFAADRVSMVDYALEAGGAKIFRYGTSPNYREGLWHTLAGTATHSPTVILSPVGSMRGKCWAFSGERGYVTVQLPVPVKVSSFSLEHIARSLAVTPGSAPRKFQVLGLPSPSSADYDVLGEYEYVLRDEQTVQTFPVQKDKLPANTTLTYPYVVLSILSNYGNPDFTCIYRFRVHGEPALDLNTQSAPLVDPT